MPRIARAVIGGLCHRVINRGKCVVGGVSPAGGLCAECCWLLQEAAERVGMRLLAYCLMPNHWSQEGRHGLGLG